MVFKFFYWFKAFFYIGAGAGASVGAGAGEKNTRAGQKWTGSATLNYIQHRMVHNTNVR